HETHTLSALSVNQLTAAFVRSREMTTSTAPGLGVAPAQAGFTSIRPQNPDLMALPRLTITNLLSVGPSSFTEQDQYFGSPPDSSTTRTTLAIKDDLIRAVGRHTLKTGAGFRAFALERVGDTYGQPRNGDFDFANFNPDGTGNAVADFLLGLP